MTNKNTLTGDVKSNSSSSIEITYFAQSMSNVPDAAPVETVAAAVTEFVENSSVVSRPNVLVTDSAIPVLDEKIASFVARPVLLSTNTFSITDGIDANLYSCPSIGTLLLSNSTWMDKFSGYGLMRGTFVLRLELNATPFQQGSLLLHYVPCFGMYDKATNRFNSHLVQKVQHPHVIVTMSDTAAEIEIPFVTPEDYFRLWNRPPNFCDWGGVFLDVFTPLKVGTSATQTFVDFQVYGYWKNVSLAAPMVAQSSRSVGVVNPELKPSGSSISTGLMSISTGASALSGVPLIGSYMTPLSWVARAASGVAAAFGYSKPVLDNVPTVDVIQPTRNIGNSEGADASVTLALAHDNAVQRIADYSSNGRDEMSYSYLCKEIMNLTGIHDWTSSFAPDTVIFNRYIDPPSLVYSTYDIIGDTGTTTYGIGGPLYYLGNIHAMWRGSLKLNLKFIKTKFHSGKIMVTFTPLTGYTTPVDPGISGSELAIREIIDIRELSEVTLTLPYLIPSKYLNVSGNTNSSLPPECSSGFLSIKVLNQLRNPDTAADSIQIIESYTAGDDFEFAFPCSPQYGTLDGEGNAVKYGFPFVAQSSGVIVDTAIGGISSGSKVMKPTELCVGEMVSSVKQLLNRYSSGAWTSLFPSSSRVADIDPWYLGVYTVDAISGVPVAPQMAADAMGILAPLYLFQRGSIRALISPSSSVSASSLYWGAVHSIRSIAGAWRNFINPSYLDTNPGGQVWTFDLVNRGTYLPLTVNSVNTSTQIDGFAHFRVPYISRFPVSLTELTFDAGGRPSTGYEPLPHLSVMAQTNFGSHTGMGRSVGDDFQLLYFINTLPLIVGYTTNP